MTDKCLGALRKIAAGAGVPVTPPANQPAKPQPPTQNPQSIHPDWLYSATGGDEDGGILNEWLDYEVQPGDNPTTIAKRLGVPLPQFMQWNKLNEQNSRRLRPRQVLRYRNPDYTGN